MPEALDFAVERADVDAQVSGGVLAISFAALKRFGDQKPLHGLEAHRLVFVPAGGGGRAQFRRQVIQLDHAAPAEDERLLDDVLQFTDISRIVMFHEPCHDFIGNARDVLALQVVELRDQVVDQQGNVFAALLKARQFQMDHADAIVQVVAERAGLDQLGQVLVRGRHDTDIDGDRLNTAERFDHSFLEHPQQSDLHGRRNIADLVQEDRAAVGQREPPRLVAFGVGEGPRFVPEQLALQQRVRQRRTVDGHKPFPLARRKVVNGAGKQFLARAARSLDEHGAAAGRDLRQDFEQLHHGRASADDVFESVSGLKLLLELLDLGEVLERLDPADHRSLIVLQQRRGDPDRHALALLVDDVGRGVDDRLGRWPSSAAGAVASRRCWPGTPRSKGCRSRRSRETPVIRSAALLKAVIRQSRSTVKTPSLTESRIVTSRCFGSVDPSIAFDSLYGSIFLQDIGRSCRLPSAVWLESCKMLLCGIPADQSVGDARR